MEAAEALKLTPKDMLKNKLIDGVIKEPVGGAHADHDAAFALVKKEIKKALKEISALDPTERVNSRIEKYSGMGVFNEL